MSAENSPEGTHRRCRSPCRQPCSECPPCAVALNNAVTDFQTQANANYIIVAGAIAASAAAVPADVLASYVVLFNDVTTVIIGQQEPCPGPLPPTTVNTGGALQRIGETECNIECCKEAAEAVVTLGINTIQSYGALVQNPLIVDDPDARVALRENLYAQLLNSLQNVYRAVGCADACLILPPPEPIERCLRIPSNTCYNCYIPKYKLDCPVKYCRPIPGCFEVEDTSESEHSCHKKKEKKHKKSKKSDKKKSWLKKEEESSETGDKKLPVKVRSLSRSHSARKSFEFSHDDLAW